MEHTLVLMRHAKSDYPDGIPDHERPLAARGRRDAPRMGEWIRDNGYLPDLVLCSTAQRTRQTWDLVATELGGSPAVTYDPRIYEASTLGMLMLVRELPGDTSTAMIVGHNPGTAELVAGLTGQRVTSFPTATVAIVRIAGQWGSVAPGEATLLALVTPGLLSSRLQVYRIVTCRPQCYLGFHYVLLEKYIQ
ncbi:MAG: histidine phosphatase family protein [Streptosporangiaceae bacterium]